MRVDKIYSTFLREFIRHYSFYIKSVRCYRFSLDICMRAVVLTFPTIGSSTEPHVSAAQWTRPEPKSAVKMPQSAAAITMPIRSTQKYRIIRNKFNIIKLMHVYTQITSCIRLPGGDTKKICYLHIQTYMLAQGKTPRAI